MGRGKREAPLQPRSRLFCFPIVLRALSFFFFPLLVILLGYPAGASAEERGRILFEEFFSMIVLMCICKLYSESALFCETKTILSPWEL